MSFDLVGILKEKRKEIAKREGKELFMILSNATIELMAEHCPQTREALLAIKGWGPKKLERYGTEFLQVLQSEAGDTVPQPKTSSLGPKKVEIQIGQESLSLDFFSSSETKDSETKMDQQENKPLSVSEFLHGLNQTFVEMGEVQIQGEIDDVSIRKGYAFFELKDSIGGFEAEASLGCFVGWRALDQVEHLLEAGMEVVIRGIPKIYVKNGSFRVEVVSMEPIGEGALQKAFEALKKKLDQKGYFDVIRKREIPPFVRRVALITSMKGAAVVDFQKNLGSFGMEVVYTDVRVEGDFAEESMVRAMKQINGQPEHFDVIVLIRGGGSLQSLKAFNSERVADAIYGSRIPVLTGIGHERDETIAGLVSDKDCSTPTAVANFLRSSYERATQQLETLSVGLVSKTEKNLRESVLQLQYQTDRMQSVFENILERTNVRVQRSYQQLSFGLERVFVSFERLQRNFLHSTERFQQTVREQLHHLSALEEKMKYLFEKTITETKQQINIFHEKISGANPEQILERGYSITYDEKGRVLKRREGIKVGTKIITRLYQGTLTSRVEDGEK